MDIKRILAPIDFSPRSLEELRWAVTLSRNFGSDLLVIHIVPPEVADAAVKGKGENWGDTARAELIAEASLAAKKKGESWDVVRAGLITEARLLVDEVCRELSVAGLQHEEHVITGEPVEEILKAAKREKADLIVLSSRGRKGLSHALLGSVTEGIMRQSPVPVFTLSHEAAVEAA